MRTLNVSISDIEYNKFGLKNDELTFSDFLEIVSKELIRQNLNKCLELADKYGLSKMTMDEISSEVKTVRRNAKNNNLYKCYRFFIDSAKLPVFNHQRTFH